jgi:hypothetical protein
MRAATVGCDRVSCSLWLVAAPIWQLMPKKKAGALRRAWELKRGREETLPGPAKR